MVIEKLHGLQNTTITLSERFTIMTAEYLRRVGRPRNRGSFGYNQGPRHTYYVTNQMSLRMQQTLSQPPVTARLGMPGLRRFGSDGNLPGLQHSNSVDNIYQFRNRIPWRQSNGNLSRASSVSNLSRASWHGRGGTRRLAGRIGPLKGRLRALGWRHAGRQQMVGQPAGKPRGLRGAARGRGRGGVNRSQQYRLQQNNNQLNENQQNNIQKKLKPNLTVKKIPTKEELDAQLDQYMATSQLALDKELDEYMLKGALMDFE